MTEEFVDGGNEVLQPHKVYDFNLIQVISHRPQYFSH
jgi:hypothetical protein